MSKVVTRKVFKSILVVSQLLLFYE